MFKKITFVLMILCVFAVVPALADSCSTGAFVGTYTRASPATDAIGDGNLHAFLFQLTLHGDGTVTQYWTGLPDYQTSLGTGSINIGSWKCRDNGNLLVTLISASYEASAADPNFGTVADVRLWRHFRSTYVFDITNGTTITRTKARTRSYLPAEDPTDANGGILGTLSTTPLVYNKLVATATDLQLP
ncbi:MAG: hypothetical protein ABI791_03000 [Acidobacteriota bacterium]